MIRLLLALMIVLPSACAAYAQSADAWPDRPVRIIVPFQAGSATDTVTRVLAQKFGAKFGRQFVVENRAGTSGILGVDTIAKAQPDGYTMGLITASTNALAPALGAKPPYDPVSDFKPISMIAAAPYALVVYSGLPAKSVSELVALAKSKPGVLSYGSAGLSSLAHLAGALFASRTGAQLTHVPYRSTTQSSIDMITGRLDMQFATIAPTLESIRDGKLRALATTGSRRTSVLPDVPTMIEAGVTDYEVSLWMAYVMPAGTPDVIVRKLNGAMRDVLSDPEVIATLQQQSLEPDPGKPEDVTRRISDEIRKWRQLADAIGIKAE
jgi:tripartite-type tricarboxylate transporter receptor subunit TctC